MSTMTDLRHVVQHLSGAALVGDGSVAFQRVHTDTRTVQPGDLFVALRGERFDANDFLQEAQQRGAVAALCHAGLAAGKLPAGLPRIEVADTRTALAQLAAAWRAQFALPLIAVTGSNGKTTVTQMIASILAAQQPDGGSLATQGNLNNDIGVPLTLLRLRRQHAMAVVELGMNHPGEIAALAALAQPTVALVNNAQREHLEFMQTIEAVARENGSVLASMGASGIAVFPSDDAYTGLWRQLAGTRRVLTFSMQGSATHDSLVCRNAEWLDGAWSVHAEGIGASLQYRLAIAGRHNVLNSLAAATCALAAGVAPTAVEQGLTAFVPVKGRSRAMALSANGRCVTVVDDSYNANPDSVKAAIDVLAELPGPRVLVLGDMGEVGHQGPQFHAEAGRYAQARGIEHLLALGELSRVAAEAFPGARHFDSMDALIAAMPAALVHARSVLVKGSRFMRMEQAVAALMQLHTPIQEHTNA